MDDAQTIKIEKDINEASGNDVYEEYCMTFQNCKQEEGALCKEGPSDQLPNPAQTQNASDNTRAAKLSSKMKKSLVYHFITNGCSSESYNEAVERFSKKHVDAFEAIKQVLKEAPEYVYQESESLCFVNISDWLQVLKERNVPDNNFYEPGVILNAIVNNEQHPDKTDVNGIDMKEIYTFLSNGLMGLPQKSMDPISAKFLAAEFQSLINEANSDFADAQTMSMKEHLESLKPQKEGESLPSLDPLLLLEDPILRQLK